jgi:hypothetical protein
VVGQRDGVHAQLFGPFDQCLQPASAVEHAVVTMDMEMDKFPP